VRSSRGVAERKVGKQEARNADVLDDVLGAAHDDCRDALRLERSRDERERLVAHGAVGNQQRGVGAVFPAARDEFGRVDLERRALAAIGRRPVEARGGRADSS